jgi:hypothetical protein
VARQKSRIGQYRHTPAALDVVGPDGVVRVGPRRRPFPYLFAVFLAFGLLGPLVCAGVAELMDTPALSPYVPRRLSELPLPPQPSVENVLFGAGLHEMVLAAALAGLLLWRLLWRQRPPAPGLGAAVRVLLPQGLLWGPLLALAGLPVAAFGLFLRTGPADIPWAVRPLFALLSTPFTTTSALLTGVIPLTVLLLGLLFGAVCALAVALTWPHFPER